ncbi:MAG: CDP-alcohol phosphatidyltransferase family protein [Candidatus Latescibacteria bacterium]|nr:CDP-alcohol phosphatidyltransferase family protein [Candidatus Latescibacterota bacterium]NIM66456.1 CDP-alcohol phosphatidyltransferase family protein [Candidatus Latescibacterota bacterium]NIO02936.1 CDP-alcohol phosphatidyltransferase family protein [Candidatus Latescibacterota bacterium]NIO30071.1 CDP-alcohol phosphatidyltransferase family protein [Candidatus Latescibacterota bacterium]NIO57686.1 CDP-alcohol phosphatidyltransferase family protein [Candidatus Latescibacterota bacterium]
MAMDKQGIKTKARGLLNPIVSALAALGVPPLLISCLGLALSIYGAVLLAGGSLFRAGILLIVAGFCDVIDGALARSRNIESRFGAFIDSTFDRITEFAYFGGILLYFIDGPGGFNFLAVASAFIALAGSVLTSYARARAEGLGLSCTVGAFERPERIALLVLGLLLGRHVLIAVLLILSVVTLFTFLQRIFHIYRLTREDAGPRGSSVSS